MSIIKVEDVFRPSMPGDVRLEGWLGGRLDAMIENSVMAWDVERIVRPFREKTDEKDGGWRCEYWGKWATAVALAAAYSPTAGNLSTLDKAASGLLATQEPDGYIGTRKPEGRLKDWDVWGRKYVLLGLLGNYDVTGDKSILDAARRHADSLLAECGPGKANIAAIGYPTWKGLPPSSILEPMVLLYQRTSERKYLEFAEHIVGQWSQPNHWSPNGLRLVEDAISGVPAAKLGDTPKAYEMMSCYEGLCELHRVTCDSKYLKASIGLAESIFRDELTVIGSGSADEVWKGGRRKQCGTEPFGIETCVTVTWMKLCFQLLRLTGDPKYADALETSLYNAMLGALTPAGQWWAYSTGLLGDRVPSHQQQTDVGACCCVLNGPRSMLLTPRWAVMANNEGIVVNLYNRGSADMRLPSGHPARFEMDTAYPADGLVSLKIHLKESETFTLSLRIPQWSARTSLLVNGEQASVKVEAGSYAKIRRKWSDGDSIELGLDMRGRVVADPGGAGCVSVARGPVVMALDNRLCPKEPTTALDLEFGDDGFVTLTPNQSAAAQHGLWMAFDAVFKAKDGARRTLTLCDFSSAGNTWEEWNLYRVWLADPLDLAAVWDGMPPPWWLKPYRPKRPEMPPAAPH